MSIVFSNGSSLVATHDMSKPWRTVNVIPDGYRLSCSSKGAVKAIVIDGSPDLCERVMQELLRVKTKRNILKVLKELVSKGDGEIDSGCFYVTDKGHTEVMSLSMSADLAASFVPGRWVFLDDGNFCRNLIDRYKAELAQMTAEECAAFCAALVPNGSISYAEYSVTTNEYNPDIRIGEKNARKMFLKVSKMIAKSSGFPDF